MDLPSWSFGQPVADEFCLVRRIIVHDEMNLKVGGNLGFDPVKELAKLS